MNWAEAIFIIERLSEKINTLSIEMENMNQILTLIAEKLDIEINTPNETK